MSGLPWWLSCTEICLPMQEMQVWPLGQEDPLEKETATHSCILAWEIPWTEDPGGLQSMGLQKSGTRISDWTATNSTSHTSHVTHRILQSYQPIEFLVRLFWARGPVDRHCGRMGWQREELWPDLRSNREWLTLWLPFCRSAVSNSLWPQGLWPLGSSVHGVLQARILEWIAISFSNHVTECPNFSFLVD